MIAAASLFALIAISIAVLLNVYRLIVGPDAQDRILALDTLVINAIGLVVLLGILLGTSMYFEAALLISITGFVSSAAMAKFLLRGEVIE